MSSMLDTELLERTKDWANDEEGLKLVCETCKKEFISDTRKKRFCSEKCMPGNNAYIKVGRETQARDMFEMVEDMIHIDAGGFKPGVRFNRQEMEQMLDDKVLAKGTILKNLQTGENWVVSYGWNK